jgi:hypothetical protein
MATGMLTDQQITRVWEHLLAAETRALYFGDLVQAHTRRKQWITGLSLFGSSAAFATVLAALPAWLPAGLALVGALASIYAIAANLDGQIATMARLYAAWHGLALQYEQLWDHTWTEDAEVQLERIVDREREPSELAVAGAPYDERRLAHWQDRVFALRHLTAPA